MTELMSTNDWLRRLTNEDLSLRKATEMHHDNCTVDLLTEIDGFQDKHGNSNTTVHPIDLERFMVYADGEGWDLVQVVCTPGVFDGKPLAILRKKAPHRLRDETGKLTFGR